MLAGIYDKETHKQDKEKLYLFFFSYIILWAVKQSDNETIFCSNKKKTDLYIYQV